MLSLGPLSFGAPWVLAGLLAVPALLWLLRVTPPAPRRVRFPAIQFLLGLAPSREEPLRTPLWLVLLRMFLAALIIIALADPAWRRVSAGDATLPLLLVVDDGWAAAPEWAARKRTMLALVDDAARGNRPVAILTTAPRDPPLAFEPLSASDARARLEALEPVPWHVDRAGASERLAGSSWTKPASVVWIADGLDTPGSGQLIAALKKRGALRVALPARTGRTLMLLPPQHDGNKLTARVRRAETTEALTGTLRATAGDGRLLGEASFRFKPGAPETSAAFDLPLPLINDIARIEISGQRTAGAVALMDDESRKRSVGLVSGSPEGENQPLLSDLFYLERALAPFASVARGTLATLASPDRAMIVLADVGRIGGTDATQVTRWVEAGGTLVRFAGPRLAQQSDALVPVPLRQGGRTLGGALSWEEPQSIGPFEPGTPFAGLSQPKEVHVKRQVLAEPVPDLAARTWARLTDGTPLVTASPRGKGRVVLIHVTANTDWSDLPLSGVFVEMLQRLTRLAASASDPGSIAGALPNAVAAPYRTLDGYGVLGPPPAGTQALDPTSHPVPGPQHPPGLYGTAEAPVAFNLGRADTILAPLNIAGAMTDARLIETHARALMPWLLCAALLVALADAVAVAWLSGGLAVLKRRPATAGGLAILVAAALGAAPADARDADAFALEATHSFHLAYVRTGDAETDAISRAGLEGLSRSLSERSAVEPDKPMGVDLETDEIAFFPLLYWQISPHQPPLSDAALQRLDRFMKTGGTLIIDTADANQSVGGRLLGPGQERLRTVLAHLDLPPLEPVPPDHVLTKSFYLVQDFPGRYAGARLWVEAAHGGADHDGVASIMVGANDWAAAWARDANGHALLPLVPGGDMQREMAVRFGVNLVMYALTGNYKADQVHVPALLERLGQ